MMKKLLFVLGLLTILSEVSVAQDMSLYVKKEFTSKSGATMPYRILYPENYDPKGKYPVILFLHGAGERGNDNEKQLVHGSKLFLKPENREKYPCIVIFPQCPAEGFWSSVVRDNTKRPHSLSFDYQQPITPSLSLAMSILRQVIKQEGVDKKRVYIAGLSMGGMGTFEAVYRFPKVFAAAMPICGGGDANSYNAKAAKLPFRVFHGEKDSVVPVEESRRMVEKLKALNGDVRYTEYPGVDHNSWDNAFMEPDFLSWMWK